MAAARAWSAKPGSASVRPKPKAAEADASEAGARRVARGAATYRGGGRENGRTSGSGRAARTEEMADADVESTYSVHGDGSDASGRASVSRRPRESRRRDVSGGRERCARTAACTSASAVVAGRCSGAPGGLPWWRSEMVSMAGGGGGAGRGGRVTARDGEGS